MECNNFCRVWHRYEETESLTESCSDTRSKRGSKGRVSETVSVSNESVDSQKPAKKFRSDVWDYFKKNASGKKVWCQLRYSSDVTLHSLTSNLLALLSNLLVLVQSYSWHVLYYPRLTHARLFNNLWGLFLTWLRMLTVIDHHNVLRLVLVLVSRSQNLCHRTLTHQALIIFNE